MPTCRRPLSEPLRVCHVTNIAPFPKVITLFSRRLIVLPGSGCQKIRVGITGPSRRPVHWASIDHTTGSSPCRVPALRRPCRRRCCHLLSRNTTNHRPGAFTLTRPIVVRLRRCTLLTRDCRAVGVDGGGLFRAWYRRHRHGRAERSGGHNEPPSDAE